MGLQVVSLAEEVESVLYVGGRINWIFGKLLVVVTTRCFFAKTVFLFSQGTQRDYTSQNPLQPGTVTWLVLTNRKRADIMVSRLNGDAGIYLPEGGTT